MASLPQTRDYVLGGNISLQQPTTTELSKCLQPEREENHSYLSLNKCLQRGVPDSADTPPHSTQQVLSESLKRDVPDSADTPQNSREPE